MDLNGFAQSLVEFVRNHQAWAAPIVFALAFAESLAFLSLVIPAWGALVGIGVLLRAGDISFWQVWLAGAVGAALGDWLSFWIGYHFHDRIIRMWPLSKYPDMVPRAERFIAKWGVPGVFIGRFFGPLRAAVPLVAGAFEMPYWHFQFANFTSAFLWAAVLLLFGDALARITEWGWAVLSPLSQSQMIAVISVAAVLGVLVLIAWYFRRRIVVAVRRGFRRWRGSGE